MYSDYLRLGSLAKVATLYGRTRQSMHVILARRFRLNPPHRGRKNPSILHAGQNYTLRTDGYFRSTKGSSRELLHHVVWRDHHGPVPAGHQVTFLDGNTRNVAIENLACLPASEVGRMHSTGENQFTRYHAIADPLFEKWMDLVLGSSDADAISAAQAAFDAIPRPSSPDGERQSVAQRAAWARLTPKQKTYRLRGIHRRWIERRETLAVLSPR